MVTPWNFYVAQAIKKEVKEYSPDIVHVHNTFPIISPAIFHAVGNNAAKVITLHNYRLFCPAAIPMRDGKVCTLCIDNDSIWPALKYGCYKKSKLKTLPLAFTVALHKRIGTWTKKVDAFIALSEFQRELMVKVGLPEDRVYVKPNFTRNLISSMGKTRQIYSFCWTPFSRKRRP